MSDEPFTVANSPEASLLALIALISDPKAAKTRLAEILTERTNADKSLAALAQARVAFDQQCADRTAALDKRERQIADLNAAVQQREDDFKADKEAAKRREANALALETSMRHNLVTFSGMLPGFDNRIQALPTLENLKQMLKGRSGSDDPALQGGKAKSPIFGATDDLDITNVRRPTPPRPVHADR